MGNIIKVLNHDNYVEEPRKFEDSFFSEVYRKAKKIVKEILDESEYVEDLYIRDGESTLRKDSMNNMIAFIGERGSGKTTTMFSFLNYLNNYKQNLLFEKEDPFQKIDFGEIEFYCLDYIDGGLLEKRDNILQILIGNMYRKFLRASEKRFHNDWREYDIRELQEIFIRVENSIQKISNGENTGYSSIENLKNITDSLNLKRELIELIQKYLQLMGSEKERYKDYIRKRVLVIAIDDLDLNYEHGFEILENIHRYLMIPNVIVVIAAEYKQLMNLCMNHFSTIYRYLNSCNLNSIEKQDIVKMSDAYLDKLIPIQKRIYLNSFAALEEVEIEGDINGFEKIKIEDYILKNFYQKTGLYLFKTNENRYFYKPGNLREFNQFIKFIRNLDNVNCDNFEKNDINGIVEKNYEEILNDFFQRRLREELEEGKYEYMKMCATLDLKHSGEMFLKYFIEKQKTSYDVSETNRKFRNNMDFYNNMDYSYGNLLYLMWKCFDINVEERKFVECILVYYTLKLNQIKYIEKESDHKTVPENILDFVRDSVFGFATNEMLPSIVVESGFEKNNKDSNRIDVGNIEIDYYMKDKIEFAFNIPLDFLVNFANIIKGIEIMLLFFTTEDPLKKIRVKINNFNIEEIAGVDREKNYLKIMLEICLPSNTKIYFNPWGFIVNLMKIQLKSGDEDLYKVEDNILSEFEKEVERAVHEANIRNLLDLGNEPMGRREFEYWGKQYGYFVLPIYNPDLLFNIMRNMVYKKRKSISYENVSELIGEINKMYYKCGFFLKEELEKNKVKQQEEFVKCFKNCPSINLFGRYYAEEWFQYIFKQFYYTIINCSKIDLQYHFVEEELE